MDSVNTVNKPSFVNLDATDAMGMAKRISQVAELAAQAVNVASAEPRSIDNKGGVALDLPEDASGEDFLTALMAIQNELSKGKMLATREDIKESKVRSEAEHKKNLEKMSESQEKAKEAEKSGMAQKVFGWIATALSVVVAAVITVATLGAGAGVGALICAGVALATTLASTAIQAANEFQVEVNGVKMGAFNASITQLAMGDGWDQEKAGEIGAYSAMAIQMALAIIGMVASLGASGVGKMSELANMGGKLSAKLADNVVKGLKNTSTALNTVGGVTTVGTSSAGIATATLGKEASDAQAERMDIKANLAQERAEQQKLQEQLKQMMEEMQSIFETIMQIMQGNADTANSIIKRTNV